MKTLAVLSLMVAVALGRPPLPPGEPPYPVLMEENQRPLVGDWVPAQGHVEVEDPAPQPRLSDEAAEDTKQSQREVTEVEVEVKVEPEVRPQTEDMEEGEVKVKPEVKMEEEVFKVHQEDADVETAEAEMMPELKADQEFKVEMEENVDPAAEEFQVEGEEQMQDAETGLMTEEQFFNHEEEFVGQDEPHEEEPLDDDSMLKEEVRDTEELSDIEKDLRGRFMGQENEPVQFEFDGGVEDEERRKIRILEGEQGIQGRSSCPGVELDGKCYQFFRGPKRAEEAEFFCQTLSTRGHLASITSSYAHRQLMSLMLRQNGGYTRTWVGGLRYLDTDRFVWLDGSHWGYADWLPGEPNHTANLENCVELLPWGNGLFNDFTCWEPQAFICSY